MGSLDRTRLRRVPVVRVPGYGAIVRTLSGRSLWERAPAISTVSSRLLYQGEGSVTRKIAIPRRFMCSKSAVWVVPFALLGLVVGDAALAQSLSWTPAQVSLLPSVVQLPTEDAPVKGLSLNLYYGAQPSVSGLQLGLISEVESELKGIDLDMISLARQNVSGMQTALVNFVGADAKGVQVGALSNQTTAALTGAQLGLANASGSGRGVQLGFFNSGGTEFGGGQLGGVSLVSGKLRGAQLGAVSLAMEECSGFQMGMLMNYAKAGGCLQIGLLNFSPKGFLPVFPLFNLSR